MKNLIDIKKPIIFTSDHGGYELKEKLKGWLVEHGFKVDDVGTNSAEPVDYPGFTKKAVKLVLHHKTVGIFVCGAGVGVSIVANRFKGIRAALPGNNEIVTQLSRQHNDANVLCLGGRFIDFEDAKKLVQIFLETPALGDAHARRVRAIDEN